MSLIGLALILGWWDLLYHHSRDPPPIVQTIFAWAFLLIIAFPLIPDTSRNRPAIGLSLVQQPISLLVLKSGTGFHTFEWLRDPHLRLAQGLVGAAFFFNVDTVNTKHLVLRQRGISLLSSSLHSCRYHLGIMQWIIKNFAWFFFKTMNVSGAEAVVALTEVHNLVYGLKRRQELYSLSTPWLHIW
ncbi:hypothetical protein EDB92DRAFT_1944583 [Lactarius akahatsu]|uniref:Uncharacterized protein n=1 Tax=Lactarius akahatsu TaxID=416441 RepID=A0AAD4LJW9_9AGAM|nr:hypothetical protein EDB92DRAFT_1944583 [Lactarius akahatsu]